MAEDFASVAVVQPSFIDTVDVHRDLPVRADHVSFADHAENGVQLLSRWAGILAFAGAVIAIAYLIF